MKVQTNLKAGSGGGHCCRGGSLINVSDNNVAVAASVLSSGDTVAIAAG